MSKSKGITRLLNELVFDDDDDDDVNTLVYHILNSNKIKRFLQDCCLRLILKHEFSTYYICYLLC